MPTPHSGDPSAPEVAIDENRCTSCLIAYDGVKTTAFEATRPLRDDDPATWRAAVGRCLEPGPGMRLPTLLGDTLPTDPDASPIFADLRNLAPPLVQTGENQAMLSSGIELARGKLSERSR